MPLLFLAGLFVGQYENNQPVAAQLRSAVRKLDARITKGRLGQLYVGETNLESAPPPDEGAYSWIGSDPFLPIAHAMGPQLFAGANQIETLEEGRKRGFRIFEVDLAVTLDNHMVCLHGNSETELDRMTYVDYLEIIRRQNLQPCEFRDLVKVVSKNPGIAIVLDVKNRFDYAYQIARAEIGTTGLGRSFIPQIYHFDQLRSFRADHFFAGEIFTSYRSYLSNEAVIASARRLHVRVIALTRQRTSDLTTVPADLWVFTHPVDDAFDAVKLRLLGLRGIYTSYLTPWTTPELFQTWTNECIPLQNWAHCAFTSFSQSAMQSQPEARESY